MSKPSLIPRSAPKNPKNHYIRFLRKGFGHLKEHGLSLTWEKAKDAIKRRRDCAALNKHPLYSPDELALQRQTKSKNDVMFSILVPLYNTPESFLNEMIQSVLDQTYSNWELCLADGSDEKHANVKIICTQYEAKDARIHYQKLEKNLGISGNTNACVDMAKGDYLALLDHDDLLHPAALFEMMKAICESGADFIYTDENTFHRTPKDACRPHFKPDYAPDTLRSLNYICHFIAFKRSLMDKVGKFRPECDGSQDYDMVLRLTEQAEKIVHIPKILYYWRAHADSVSESTGTKPYTIQAAHRALQDHLDRTDLKGEVLDAAVPTRYRIRYKIDGMPQVSVLIPGNERKIMETCLESIFYKTTYPNFEVIAIEGNSTSQETIDYYKGIEAQRSNFKMVTRTGCFNRSAAINFGASHAKGDYLILLNSNTEVIASDWIQEMLMFAQRYDVGAVGAKLYDSNNKIHHAGLALGLLGLTGRLHRGYNCNHSGYMDRLMYAQNLSAVSGDCMMIRRALWNSVGGMDEAFALTLSDVDLCLRIRKAGHLIVWTPFSELYYHEPKGRGEEYTSEQKKQLQTETCHFRNLYATELANGDPYYNPNFSLDREDFTIR